MGCVAKKRGEIDSILIDELKNLSSIEQLNRYKSEFKLEIIKLLKECYSDTLSDKIIFYDESLKSLIGHYDPELLLINLFLEKDSITISNHLLKKGSFNMIRSKYLSPFTDEYLVFLTNTFKQNSKLVEEDEIKFVQETLKSIIKEINKSHWASDENNNLLVRTFIKWIDSKFEDTNITTAFLIFTKIWNNNSTFEKSFNTKSIYLYNELIAVLKRRLNNSEVESFIKFIDNLKGFQTLLFNDINYYPIIDNKESNKYSNGYVIRRNEYFLIFDQAKMISQINTDLSYYELVSLVNDNSPEYLIAKINKIIDEKVNLFVYPTNEEIESIWQLKSNNHIDILRIKLKKKLYLYDIL